MKFRFTAISETKKLGPIPSVIADRGTCPTTCPLKSNGCYADNFPLSMWWGRVNLTLDDLCNKLKALPLGQLWRYAIAGDLPGDGININRGQLNQLVAAAKGTRGFAYTHYLPTPHNKRAIEEAIAEGFTINLSANNFKEVDKYKAMGLPVVTLLPKGTTLNTMTPAGHTVVPCPADTRGVTCSTCKLCSVPHRKVVVGFPTHGSKQHLAERVYQHG